MKKGWTSAIFWLILVSFLVILAYFLFPILEDKINIMLFLASFSLLGVILLFKIKKEKYERILRIYLLITAWSAASVMLGAILHNVLYALSVWTENIIILNQIFNYLHVLFFIISVLIAPIAYIVGVIGVLTNSRR